MCNKNRAKEYYKNNRTVKKNNIIYKNNII